MAQDEKIGFIGIGNMGGPMAANLIGAGYAVTVYDINPAQVEKFAADHDGTAAPSLAEVAANADIVITMLPTGPIVRSVVLEQEGGALAAGLGDGGVIIDMSSSEPVGTRELSVALAGQGITLVDAPVSGGIPGAEKGSLTIIVGGDDEAVIGRITPLLEVMGDNIFRPGPVGSGHAVKALNNLLAATNFLIASEAVLIGRKFGLDADTIVDIINVSSGRNSATLGSLKNYVLPRTFDLGFTAELMAKDVKIASDLANDVDVPAPVAKSVADLWAAARDRIGGATDFTAAFKAWEEDAGL